MRIALLTSQWPAVRLGGIGAYTRHCAKALARAGHEAHVFTLRLPADARDALPAAVMLHEIAEPDERSLPNSLPMGGTLKYQMALQAKFAAEVLAAHERQPFDILEAPEYEAPAFKLLAGHELPIVTQLHSGSAILRDVHGLAPDQEQALREALELEVIAGADGLCAPSRCVIRDTQRAYGLPDLAAHGQVIPLPFDAPPADTIFELPAADAPVVYVGRLELLKGAHLLAQAAGDFLRQHAAATLRIIGPDTLTAPNSQGQSSGKSMAEWMRGPLAGVADRVEFLGERTAAEIAAEMRRAAFIVIPSLRESYSYVCCEALAAGRPVVVSSDIGAAEVAGDAGVSFARGDAADLGRAMGQLWRDVPLRGELSRCAWHRARADLAPAGAIAQRIAFYEQVIQTRQVQGAGPIEARLFALPETHSFRLLAAQALADGDGELLPAFLQQADLPAPTLTPPAAIDRLVQCLNGSGTPVCFHLYGAGRHTARLLMEKARWEALGHRLVGLIDDHPRFQENPTCQGLPVISCAVAAATLTRGDVVILSTDAFEEQFWKNTQPLRVRGVRVHRLYG